MMPNYNSAATTSFTYINLSQSYTSFQAQINSYPHSLSPQPQPSLQPSKAFSFENSGINKIFPSRPTLIPHSPIPSTRQQINLGNNEINYPKNWNLTDRNKSLTNNKFYNSIHSSLTYGINHFPNMNKPGNISETQFQVMNPNANFKNLLTKDFYLEDYKEKSIFAFARYGKRRIDDKKMVLEVVLKTPQIENEKFKILERFNRTRALAIQNLQTIYDIYEENNSIILCCENLPHESLLDILDQKTLEESDVAVIAKALLDVVYSCNKKKVPFPDINLSNVGISRQSSGIDVKLFNNGLFLFDNLIYPSDDIISDVCFFSSQRCKGKKDNLYSGIWSIGILTHLLLGHKFPFEGGNVSDITSNIISFNLKNLNYNLFHRYSHDCIKFIEDCLKGEPIENLLVNDWLTYNLRNKDKIPVVKINDDMPLSKVNLKCIFKLQNYIYSYLSINRQLYPLIEFIRCCFMQMDISQNGLTNIDNAFNTLSEFNILLTTNEINKLVEAAKNKKTNKVDYIQLISKFISMIMEDMEIRIAKTFKELVSSKGKIAKPFFYKIINTKYDFFKLISKLIIFDLNLNPKDYISVEDLLGTLRNKCRVKSTRIFIRPPNI